MKPIKRGMTEAVTRDGRKVTQLTFLDGLKSGEDCFYGVIDGYVFSWNKYGAYAPNNECEHDIFAPTEYEWQWLVMHKETGHFLTTTYEKTLDIALDVLIGEKDKYIVISRIEESKREVK